MRRSRAMSRTYGSLARESTLGTAGCVSGREADSRLSAGSGRVLAGEASERASWEGEESAETFYAHLKELLQGIAQTEFQGYCYTQLTDVQQEINGLLRADHTPKFDLERLKKIFEKGKRKC